MDPFRPRNAEMEHDRGARPLHHVRLAPASRANKPPSDPPEAQSAPSHSANVGKSYSTTGTLDRAPAAIPAATMNGPHAHLPRGGLPFANGGCRSRHHRAIVRQSTMNVEASSCRGPTSPLGIFKVRARGLSRYQSSVMAAAGPVHCRASWLVLRNVVANAKDASCVA